MEETVLEKMEDNIFLNIFYDNFEFGSRRFGRVFSKLITVRVLFFWKGGGSPQMIITDNGEEGVLKKRNIYIVICERKCVQRKCLKV